MNNDSEKPRTFAAEFSAENWPQELNNIACDSAADALKRLGVTSAIELAFATLQAYFTLVYANSCPMFEQSAASNLRLETLNEILSSCGISFDHTITSVAIPRNV